MCKGRARKATSPPPPRRRAALAAALACLIPAALLLSLPARAAGSRPAAATGEVTLRGVRYLPLTAVAARLGMEHRWTRPDKAVTLSSRWTRIAFEADRAEITLDGVVIHLGRSIARHGGQLHLATADYDYTLAPILTPQVFAPVPKLYRIVIDPGHGGRDTGGYNRSKKLAEKAAALDVALRLKKALAPHGYQVLLTRESDRAVELPARAARANRARADLFISIHFNAFGSSKVRGIETYALTPQGLASTGKHRIDRLAYPGNDHNTWSTLAAFYTQRELVRAFPTPDRGVKRARFAVLKPLTCPGLLVEAGFLSNPSEADLIRTAAHREKIARTLATGVLRYQRTLDRLRGRN